MIASSDERRQREAILLKNIKRDLAALTSPERGSGKPLGVGRSDLSLLPPELQVFAIQSLTTTIVDALDALLLDQMTHIKTAN